LFSEVHGTILDRGIPVPNAEIVQKVVWSDNPEDVKEARARSDADGRFHFDPVMGPAGLTRLIPHQPVILQRITIRHEGVDYPAWRHTKDTYENNSELDGKPLNLSCELSRSPDFDGTHYGICKAG
jgi:hypothetical protein